MPKKPVNEWIEDEVIKELEAQLADIRGRSGKELALVYKWGGYGDFFALQCLACAVARYWGGELRTVMVTTMKGSMSEWDQVADMAELPIDVILVPPADMDRTLEVLRRHAPVVYHMPGYAVRRYVRDGFGLAESQKLGDDLLRPLADYYFDWPASNHRLEDEGLTQWEVMSKTSGLTVDPGDMRVVGRIADIPPERMTRSMEKEKAIALPSRAKLRHVDKYAVIHNQPGAKSKTKAWSHEAMQKAVDILNDMGYRVVQVGRKDEKKYKRVIDRRGFRWGLTVRLIAYADIYVGIEGSMAYIAAAAGTPAVIGFGPTPEVVFRFSGHVTASTCKCRPCWWSTPDWYDVCPKGHDTCVSLPTPKSLEKELPGKVRMALLAGKVQRLGKAIGAKSDAGK